MMDKMDSVREHVIGLIRGGQAYDTVDDIVGSFPPALRGLVPAGAERSAWQILSHMSITLADILGFTRSPKGQYVELNWPDDYWLKEAEPPGGAAWDETVSKYLADRSAIEELVDDPNRDMFAPVPAGDGQTLLREALLVADHQSYHLGQLVVLRRLLD